MSVEVDPIIKLKSILDGRSEEYAAAYKSAFGQEFAPPTEDFTGWVIEFLKQTWKFDFFHTALIHSRSPMRRVKNSCASSSKHMPMKWRMSRRRSGFHCAVP